jgi:hypothetical protein
MASIWTVDIYCLLEGIMTKYGRISLTFRSNLIPLSLWSNIECPLFSLIGVQNILSADTGISQQTKGHSFGDHLSSESVSVTPLSAIEASIMLCSVSLWLVWVNIQLACALNTKYFLIRQGPRSRVIGTATWLTLQLWRCRQHINPSRTEIHLIIYKHTVRTSQETHLFSATNTSQLMLFREMVAVYCENQMKHKNTVFWENPELRYVKACGTYKNDWALKC